MRERVYAVGVLRLHGGDDPVLRRRAAVAAVRRSVVLKRLPGHLLSDTGDTAAHTGTHTHTHTHTTHRHTFTHTQAQTDN